jgi:hypothetical protein
LSTLPTPYGGSVGILSVRVAKLLKAGLVTEELENKFQGRRLIALMEKGRKVAGYLKKLIRIFENY